MKFTDIEFDVAGKVTQRLALEEGVTPEALLEGLENKTINPALGGFTEEGIVDTEYVRVEEDGSTTIVATIAEQSFDEISPEGYVLTGDEETDSEESEDDNDE